MQKKTKVWSGRFSEPISEKVQEYTASIGFDKKLALFDIQGSKAHAEMLEKVGILSNEELNKILDGLNRIAQEIKENKFNWKIELEDVHLNIEARLTELIGEPGEKIHTARSRNDQVATDMRLWLRSEIDIIAGLIQSLEKSILSQAEQHSNSLMAGLTHLQTAQPITFGHHMMAYHDMFARDYDRLLELRKRVNCLPLGSAALAGTGFKIDREFVAKKLGFEKVIDNSLDAVSDRDFVLEFLNFSAILMIHISRLSEEIIMWASDNFGYIDIPDEFCTGSSIMPQKKNPDVAELARGKTGRAIGNLINILVLMKGQPLAYNKDNQEDKEPIFDSVKTIKDTLDIFSAMLRSIKVNKANLKKPFDRSYTTATDLADYLVAKQTTFREAHEIVSKIVTFAEKKNILLQDIPLKTFEEFSEKIEEDVFEILDCEGSIKSRSHVGGTSPDQVLNAIKTAKLKWQACLKH
ncbi:argininosuccinate lyase [Betaproteobacteria bacterium]|nr:argininosuccinate lyase [Betaproteobacteria bacterium]